MKEENQGSLPPCPICSSVVARSFETVGQEIICAHTDLYEKPLHFFIFYF
jgi:hypothetical protein